MDDVSPQAPPAPRAGSEQPALGPPGRPAWDWTQWQSGQPGTTRPPPSPHAWSQPVGTLRLPQPAPVRRRRCRVWVAVALAWALLAVIADVFIGSAIHRVLSGSGSGLSFRRPAAGPYLPTTDAAGDPRWVTVTFQAPAPATSPLPAALTAAPSSPVPVTPFQAYAVVQAVWPLRNAAIKKGDGHLFAEIESGVALEGDVGDCCSPGNPYGPIDLQVYVPQSQPELAGPVRRRGRHHRLGRPRLDRVPGLRAHLGGEAVEDRPGDRRRGGRWGSDRRTHVRGGPL
jgi:hypothetical protein